MQEIFDIGVDVAKANVVIAVQDHPELACELVNEPAALRRWLKSIPPESRLAVESTGKYHGLLVHLAQQAGLCAYVLNAWDVSIYAKALGMRGKTDRTDSQVIARYIREHHARLHPYEPGSAAQQAIDQLIRQRARLLVKQQSLMRGLQDLPGLDQERQALAQSLQAVIHTMDAQILAWVHSERALAEPFERLQTIPGVGVQGAALLTSLLGRIGFTNADALVAFSGLDPRPRDSGQKKGRRRLSKRGAALIRRQMYMCACSASRTSAFKPVYQALRTRGLSGIEAMVILARKLLRVAFALWRHQSVFEPARFGPKII